MENSVDPYHVEWLHGRYGSFLRGESLPVVTKKTSRWAFEVFEQRHPQAACAGGPTPRRTTTGRSATRWSFRDMLRVGAAGLATFQIRVPIDDENTWHVWYQTYRPDGGAPPQPEIPVYEVPLKDERGEWLRDYVDGQDIVAWITQGRISDRSREHLGRSDLGVILLRKLYAQQMERVARGEDPLCTYRDARTR